MYSFNISLSKVSYKLDDTAFDGVKLAGGNSEMSYLQLFLQFNYFSITTMTTAGFGDISPKSLITIPMVCLQLLLSVVFSTVILVKGLAHFGDTGANPPAH